MKTVAGWDLPGKDPRPAGPWAGPYVVWGLVGGAFATDRDTMFLMIEH